MTEANVDGGSIPHSYQKVSNSGSTLVATAILGDTQNDWACTFDKDTGLLWEVKTDDQGLRDQHWLYSWYNSAIMNSSSAGGICYNPSRCDTEKYVQDVNAQALCGVNDWRLPGLEELRGLVACSSGQRANQTNFYRCMGYFDSPTISSTYFPNTLNEWFWTVSANTTYEPVWIVSFASGSEFLDAMDYPSAVRLVRSGLPLVSQTAGASFDAASGMLTLPDVVILARHYYVAMQLLPDNRFGIINFRPIDAPLSNNPELYEDSSRRLKIPNVRNPDLWDFNLTPL